MILPQSRCLSLCILVAFITRTRLSLANKRNQKRLQEINRAAEDEEKGVEDESTEIWDNDPRYVFLT